MQQSQFVIEFDIIRSAKCGRDSDRIESFCKLNRQSVSTQEQFSMSYCIMHVYLYKIFCSGMIEVILHDSFDKNR